MNIKLVIKAPNQKYADQSFDVDSNWSVKQLKAYLSKKYPSKPEIGEQRLIYSGHLLKDDQALSQVFHPLSGNDSIVNIHLVCSQRTSEMNQIHSQASDNSTSSINNTSTDATENSDQIQTNLVNNLTGINTSINPSQSQSLSSSSTVAAATATTSSSTPILAQMNVNSNNLFANLANSHPNTFIPGAYFTFGMQPTIPLVNGQFANLSPDEVTAMQQLYSRLLSNYSNAGGIVPGVLPPLGFNPFLANGQLINTLGQVPLAQQQQQPQQQQQQQQPPRQNRPQQPPIEDEEEANNRDWLDWFYWISRAAVLFSIVYFYSSFTRFILVISFAIFMYLYQIGLFLPRNAIDGQQRQQQPQLARQQLQQQQRGNEEREAQNDVAAEDLPQPRVAPGAVAAGDGLRARRRSAFAFNASDAPPNDVPDVRLTGFRMVWVVLSSLFTSLIPEQQNVDFR